MELTGISTGLGNSVEVNNPDGGRFSRGLNDEEAAVAGDEGAALRPIHFHFGKPLDDHVAKAAGRGVVRGTELIEDLVDHARVIV